MGVVSPMVREVIDDIGSTRIFCYGSRKRVSCWFCCPRSEALPASFQERVARTERGGQLFGSFCTIRQTVKVGATIHGRRFPGLPCRNSMHRSTPRLSYSSTAHKRALLRQAMVVPHHEF